MNNKKYVSLWTALCFIDEKGECLTLDKYSNRSIVVCWNIVFICFYSFIDPVETFHPIQKNYIFKKCYWNELKHWPPKQKHSNQTQTVSWYNNHIILFDFFFSFSIHLSICPMINNNIFFFICLIWCCYDIMLSLFVS